MEYPKFSSPQRSPFDMEIPNRERKKLFTQSLQISSQFSSIFFISTDYYQLPVRISLIDKTFNRSSDMRISFGLSHHTTGNFWKIRVWDDIVGGFHVVRLIIIGVLSGLQFILYESCCWEPDLFPRSNHGTRKSINSIIGEDSEP